MRTKAVGAGRIRPLARRLVALTLTSCLVAALSPSALAGARIDNEGKGDPRDFQNWYWYGTLSTSFEDTVDWFDDSGSVRAHDVESGTADIVLEKGAEELELANNAYYATSDYRMTIDYTTFGDGCTYYSYGEAEGIDPQAIVSFDWGGDAYDGPLVVWWGGQVIDIEVVSTNTCDSDSSTGTFVRSNSGEFGIGFTPVQDEKGWVVQGTGSYTDTEDSEGCCSSTRIETVTVNLRCDNPCDEPTAPEDTDSCDDEGTEARYTTADGDGSVVLAGLPDPHLATVSFGVDWCLTDAGARVDRVPSKYVIPSDNWFLLGALENLGFEMHYPYEPKIEKRLRNVRATSLIGMKVNPAELVLAFAPTGKLLDKVTDGLKALLKKLKRSDTKEEATSHIAAFERFFKKKLRAWKVDFRAKVNKKIRQWHPGTRKQADKIATYFSKGLETVCDFFEGAVMYFTSGPGLKKVRDLGVKHAIKRVYERAFGKYKIPIWDVDATLYLADDGTATLSDSSSGRNIFTVKSEWTTTTSP